MTAEVTPPKNGSDGGRPERRQNSVLFVEDIVGDLNYPRTVVDIAISLLEKERERESTSTYSKKL